MHRLSTYVGAILGQAGAVRIVSREQGEECWQDQGFSVSKQIWLYGFDNGVLIRRTVEQDDFPCGQACAECWICYEVLSPGSLESPPRPARQTFSNACREAFWLKYHQD